MIKIVRRLLNSVLHNPRAIKVPIGFDSFQLDFVLPLQDALVMELDGRVSV